MGARHRRSIAGMRDEWHARDGTRVMARAMACHDMASAIWHILRPVVGCRLAPPHLEAGSADVAHTDLVA